MVIKMIKNSIISIGKKVEGPQFLKPFNDSSEEIKKLEELKYHIKDKQILKRIEQDIRSIKVGVEGERNVWYELETSLFPMICIHDITLKYKDVKAQFDYIIITNKYILVLETKKLNGDIEINNSGDFTRHIKASTGKIIKKEGMYSPITQNQRHIEVLRNILIDQKLIKNMPVISRVVIANPKSIIFDKYAKREVKEQIIKYDQLVAELKNIKTEMNVPYASQYDIADFIIRNHCFNGNASFSAKYNKHIEDINDNAQYSEKKEVLAVLESKERIQKKEVVQIKEVVKQKAPAVQLDKEKLIVELKKYRKDTADKNKVKAYYIFKNTVLDDIVNTLPTSIEDIRKINGFGPDKTAKYGSDIVAIVKKYA